MHAGSRPAIIAGLLGAVVVGPHPTRAAERRPDAPAWLQVHVGTGEGQIAQPVLQRARALYLRKVGEGGVRNPCYFAMDATRPNVAGDGTAGRRFYVICEGERSFRAIPAGHGSGRSLAGVADFANGRECAKHFGNALDSELTAGGAYLTAETRTSFKGYYRLASAGPAALVRTFLQFEGEGETANARQRAIGGHAAVTLKGLCRRHDPGDPHANRDGDVPYGQRVDYAGGRSNGCTSWSPSDADRIVRAVKDDPTTLYIYPEAGDVEAAARAVAAGQSPASVGGYWDAACLRRIGSPRYWPRARLEPLLAAYRQAHPAPPPRPLPLCAGR